MNRLCRLIYRDLPLSAMCSIALLLAACSSKQTLPFSTGSGAGGAGGAASAATTTTGASSDKGATSSSGATGGAGAGGSAAPPLSTGSGAGGAGGAASAATTTTGTSSDKGATSSSGAAGGGGAGGSATQPLAFPDKWINGENCSSEPKVQTWKLSEDTYIFRQSVCTNFEAPFLYLLFGKDKVFLEDTGAGNVDIAGPVTAVIKSWLTDHNKSSIELVVAHSHSHGDHIAGDAQFKGLPNTTVVGTSLSAVQGFFGITTWPTQIVQFDLGERVLDIIPIPGHQTSHIAVYDRELDLLLTGDTLYPGRLYISNWLAYQASIKRLVDFVEAGNPAALVLGTHIEMDVTGKDYVMQASVHKNEHKLELTYPVLKELRDAVVELGSTPQYQAHPDFIIYP